LKIKSQEDFWAGAMFVGFGLLAIFMARDYPFGSTSRMGPGYFPTWLGIIMACLGIALCLQGLKHEGAKLGKWAFKPMILLSLGFITFGWAIDHVGFVIATAALIILGAASGTEFKWKEVIIMTIVLIIGSWALFIYGLELPYPLFWWR
jgi:hypothetical protein